LWYTKVASKLCPQYKLYKKSTGGRKAAMDSRVTSTGSSPVTREARQALYAGKSEEKQICESGPMPELESMSPEELSAYQSYLNGALGTIERIKYPNLPDIHEMARESADHKEGEGRTEQQHEAQSAHGSDDGHGRASGTYVEVTHGTEFSHTGVEKTAEALADARKAKWLAAARSSMETGTAGAQGPTVQASAPAPQAPPPPPTPAAPPTPTPTPEPPKLSLKEPISEDMRLYVEAVQNAEAEGRLSSASTAAPKAPVEAPVAPAPGPAPEVPGQATVAASESGSGNAAREVVEQGAHGGKLHSVMNTANKVLGPAAIVAGGFETAHGISELKEGKTVDGSLDVTGGVAGMTSGAAITTTAFSSVSTVAGISLGAVAAGAGGVVAVADGVKDIYHGIKEGDAEKGVVGGVKTAAGAAMIAGACTGNPILVAGGAITYVGAVVYENREAIADGAKKAYHYAADGVKKGVDATKEFAGNVAHKVSEKASAIKEGAGKLIDSGVKKAGEIKDAAVQKAGEMGDAAVKKAGEIKDAVVQKAGEIKESVGNALSSAGEGISNTASKVGGGLKSAWNWATTW
jgi:hypothetical protein